MTTRRRYVLVGTGDRGLDMFARPLLSTHADVGELVGMYDLNPLRAAAAAALCDHRVPVFDSFEGMVAETRPDVVIVTSKDATHDSYIVGALRAGVDVIAEKPMTIDDERCRAILAAQHDTGRDVRVTFNYRYAPVFTAMKEVLAAGTIGEVRSVDFHWYLDTDHGADYFRRWHRRMENSGGLFVHKATHHFDLVQWWLDDRPDVLVGRLDLPVHLHDETRAFLARVREAPSVGADGERSHLEGADVCRDDTLRGRHAPESRGLTANPGGCEDTRRYQGHEEPKHGRLLSR